MQVPWLRSNCIRLQARSVPDIRVAIIEDQAEMRDAPSDLIKLWQEKRDLALGAESLEFVSHENRNYLMLAERR